MRNRIRNLGQKKKEAIEGGKVGNTNITYKDFLKSKIDAVVEVKNKMRGLK